MTRVGAIPLPYKRGDIDIAKAVRVSNMRDYLLRRGYKQKPFPRPEILYFESRKRWDNGERISYPLPASEGLDGYLPCVRNFVAAMSQRDECYEDDVWKELLGVWPWDWMSAAVKAAEGSREPAA